MGSFISVRSSSLFACQPWMTGYVYWCDTPFPGSLNPGSMRSIAQHGFGRDGLRNLSRQKRRCRALHRLRCVWRGALDMGTFSMLRASDGQRGRLVSR
jgi:hypothetical protein